MGYSAAPRLFVTLTLAIIMTSCAGKAPSRVELPQQLPSEFQQKFAIEDASLTPRAAAPETVSEETPVPVKKKRRHRHKRKHGHIAKKDEVQTPVVAHFVIPDRRPAKDPIWVGEKMT